MGGQINFVAIVHRLKVQDFNQPHSCERFQGIVDGRQAQSRMIFLRLLKHFLGTGVGVCPGQVIQYSLTLPGETVPRCAKRIFQFLSCAGDFQDPPLRSL